jgi:hypothetical protein
MTPGKTLHTKLTEAKRPTYSKGQMLVAPRAHVSHLGEQPQVHMMPLLQQAQDQDRRLNIANPRHLLNQRKVRPRKALEPSPMIKKGRNLMANHVRIFSFPLISVNSACANIFPASKAQNGPRRKPPMYETPKHSLDFIASFPCPPQNVRRQDKGMDRI